MLFRCGYCGEEIYTRYAATYHIKYKHTGMPRNFIQNKADISQYYVNRAKKDEEKNQFKIVETRRVKVPTHHVKSEPNSLVQKPESQSSTNASTSTLPDYRFLLTWSYYLAAQAAWLSPMSQLQQGQSSLPFPTDPTKFLQTMMNPSTKDKTKN